MRDPPRRPPSAPPFAPPTLLPRRELAEEIDRHTAAVSAPPKPMTAEDARVLFDNLAQQADAEQDYAA